MPQDMSAKEAEAIAGVKKTEAHDEKVSGGGNTKGHKQEENSPKTCQHSPLERPRAHVITACCNKNNAPSPWPNVTTSGKCPEMGNCPATR